MEIIIRAYCGLNAMISPDYPRIKADYERKLYDSILAAIDDRDVQILVANDFGVKVELTTLCECKFIGINVPESLLAVVTVQLDKAIIEFQSEVVSN